MPQPPPPASTPLKILMLHGYTQSGPLFRAKTRALEKSLAKAFPGGCTLIYATAPHKLLPAEMPRWDVLQPYASAITNAERAREQAEALQDEPDAWAWWRRKGDAEPYSYDGLEEGFAAVAKIIQRNGPVDGVMGFSQGAAMAAMVAAALEGERRTETWGAFVEQAKKDGVPGVFEYPKSFLKGDGTFIQGPLKFAVAYSGFPSPNRAYGMFYNPKITTPMLHFIGSLDTVVEEKRSLSLADSCEVKRVIYHPGGHFVPASQKEYVGALIAFIREVVSGTSKEKSEESVEDMDLPFGEGRL
jgi:predicted esterase